MTPDPQDWMPAVVGVAPNGARKTKRDHSRLPITASEIAREARDCRDAGASLLHLHVRDAAAGHTLDVATYREAIAAVRDAVGDTLIVQVTTEAVGSYSPSEQMTMVRALEPEAVSLAVREISPSEEDEAAAAGFFEWIAGRGIIPQYVLYDIGDVQRFASMCGRGLIPARARNILFVLGRYAVDHLSSPTDLLPLLAAWEEHDIVISTWSLCAFGRRETACAVMALALGGHARVGFENNLRLADGTVALHNAALVAAVRDGADMLGRPIANAAEARRLLGATVQ